MKKFIKNFFFFSIIFLLFCNFSVEKKKKQLLKESEKYDLKVWADFILKNSEDVDILNFNRNNFINNLLSIRENLNRVRWKDKIDDSLLFHYVIPLRVSQEPLENYYEIYKDTLYELVKNLSMKEAVFKINEWCYTKMEYKPTEPYDQNAITTIKRGFGRCEEMMILFIKSLRTVGIPAREVYTPYWPFTNSNHAWCEVWVDGRWYFLGGAEPSDLNNSWFKDEVKRTGVVLSPVFGKGQHGFDVLNVSGNYFSPVKLKIKGEKNSIVSVSVFNFSGLLPVLMDTLSDSLEFELGKNSYFLFGYKQGKIDYQVVDLFSDTTIYMQFDKDDVEDMSFVLKVSDVEKEERDVFYKPNFDSLNAIRKENFEKLDYKGDTKDSLLNRILIESRGNFLKILRFYEVLNDDQKIIFKKFLKNFSSKDLVSLDTVGLCKEIKAINSIIKGFDDSIVENYIISQRINNEPVSFYRYELLKRFKKFKNSDPEKTYERVSEWVKKNIKDDNSKNFYKTVKTPLETYILKKGNELEKNILKVAIMRSLNIPAKLIWDMKIVSFYNQNGWVDKSLEERKNFKKFIFLKFYENGKNVSKEKNIYEDYAIEKFTGNPDIFEPEIVENFDSLIKIELDDNNYYLIYGLRDRTGSSSGYIKKIIFDTMNISLDSLKYFLVSKNTTFRSFKNFQKLSTFKIVNDGKKLLIFLDLNKEESISTFLNNKEFIKSFNGSVYIFVNKYDDLLKGFGNEKITIFEVSKDLFKDFDVDVLPTVIVLDGKKTLFWIEGLNLNLKNIIK
ncbi:MAG: transglutaminase domain-containing protein [candidate division WOR-3 bacterium]